MDESKRVPLELRLSEKQAQALLRVCKEHNLSRAFLASAMCGAVFKRFPAEKR